jgi:hypothetical protein
MSTRGALGFVVNGEIKLTYNHQDSFPDGLGAMVMDFCRHAHKHGLWDTLKERAAALTLVKDSDKVPQTIVDTKKFKSVVRRSKNNVSISPSWYEFLRPFQGAEMLWKISKGELEHMVNANDFPKDSLFCEYVYIIDLDSMTLDVFVGGQTEPDLGNPFGTEPHVPFPEAQPDKVYYPCKLVASFYLTELPEGDSWKLPLVEYKEARQKAKLGKGFSAT